MDSWLNTVADFFLPVLGEPGYWYLIFVTGLSLIVSLKLFSAVPKIVIIFFASLTLAVVLPILVLFSLLFFFILHLLLNPGNFWLCLSTVSLGWPYFRSQKSRLAEAIAKTLHPWLIGMTIVALVYIVALHVLDRSEWGALFLIESAASTLEIFLERLLPRSSYIIMGFFAFLLCANLLSPLAVRWLGRIEKTITRTKTITAVLSVFTSFTFFGEQQSQEFVRAVAAEKYDRLKEESGNAAEVLLALRISKNIDAEIASASEFIDAVYSGASMDINSRFRLGEDTYLAKTKSGLTNIQESLRLETIRIVKDRVAELREAMGNSQILADSPRLLDSITVEQLLGRPLREEERSEGKKQLQKALDKVAAAATNNGLHPLSQLLEAAGAPELARDIVKDLYKSEASRLAKGLSQPMADRLFRPSHVPIGVSTAEVNSIAGRRVFDAASLPEKVVRPTQTERDIERMSRSSVKKAVREAVRAR